MRGRALGVFLLEAVVRLLRELPGEAVVTGPLSSALQVLGVPGE
jgi:hypothetical protein